KGCPLGRGVRPTATVGRRDGRIKGVINYSTGPKLRIGIGSIVEAVPLPRRDQTIAEASESFHAEHHVAVPHRPVPGRQLGENAVDDLEIPVLSGRRRRRTGKWRYKDRDECESAEELRHAESARRIVLLGKTLRIAGAWAKHESKSG